jgi:choline-sulfatase
MASQNKPKSSLLVIIILALAGFFLNNCRNSSPGFSLKNETESGILKPGNIFQFDTVKPAILKKKQSQWDTFRWKKIFFIGLKARRTFAWKIKKDVPSGSLKFSVFFAGFNAIEKLGLPGEFPVAELNIFQKSADKTESILSHTFHIRDMAYSIDNALFFKFSNPLIGIKKGNDLAFSVKVADKIVKKNIRFGITLPRIIEASPPSGREKVPDLILISIDTLRPDYLGIYRELNSENPGFSFSPNIDSVAGQSCIFLNAYTPQSSTWPALSSIFLSLYPHQHGVLNNGDYLKYNYYSIASFMLNRGYQTLSANGNAVQLNISGFEERFNFFRSDFKLIDYVVKRIRDNRQNEPFFHWYHFLGVHANYKPPRWVMDIIDRDREGYRFFNLDKIMQAKAAANQKNIAYSRKLYAGELYHLDFELKKLFDQLKNLGLWDNALVIITADHGEDLYQHNRYFYHYPSIYNTSLRVPLIIKFPGQKKQLILKEPVSLMDIFPTLVHYFTGEKSVRDYPYSLAGNSLLDLIRGDRRAFEERILYAGTGEFQIMSAHYRNWKFIFNPRELTLHTQAKTLYPIKKIELYDILNDPLETATVSNSRIANMLITLINRFRRTYPPVDIRNSIRQDQVDDETRKDAEKVLKSLGYIH